METGKESAAALEVVVEIPRGSFLKRTSRGKVDFVSFFPCPYNYGSVCGLTGLDGDPLDAVILGPRVPRGTRMTVQAYEAVRLIDRGVVDDKLICGDGPIGAAQRFWILLFFRFYSVCKRLLYRFRGSSGSTFCAGWVDPKAAIERARPNGIPGAEQRLDNGD